MVVNQCPMKPQIRWQKTYCTLGYFRGCLVFAFFAVSLRSAIIKLPRIYHQLVLKKAKCWFRENIPPQIETNRKTTKIKQPRIIPNLQQSILNVQRILINSFHSPGSHTGNFPCGKWVKWTIFRKLDNLQGFQRSCDAQGKVIGSFPVTRGPTRTRRILVSQRGVSC